MKVRLEMGAKDCSWLDQVEFAFLCESVLDAAHIFNLFARALYFEPEHIVSAIIDEMDCDETDRMVRSLSRPAIEYLLTALQEQKDEKEALK